MELSVDFRCPACQKVFPQALTTFAVGKSHPCPACATPAALTLESLDGLRRRLEDLEPRRIRSGGR